MLENFRSFSARHAARRCSVFAVLSLTVFTLSPHAAEAAMAQVRWLPSADPGITRYDVYVRNAGAPYGGPAWSGNPTPAADGALEALVPFSTAMTGANYFAVVAVSGTTESPLSGELWTGTPIACHVDSCTTKTSCDFGSLPDGTSCGFGGADPCSAMCVDGVCGTSGAGTPATDVAIDRLRFTTHSSGTKLALKGKIETEAALDPASTGAVIELRGLDDAVLYSASIAATSFTTNAAGTRFRFAASATDGDAGTNGLKRLDLRHSGSRWIVSGQASSPALADAAGEPALTLVVRLGGTCAQHLGAECEQKATVAICR
jgi:hypothetical protein